MPCLNVSAILHKIQTFSGFLDIPICVYVRRHFSCHEVLKIFSHVYVESKVFVDISSSQLYQKCPRGKVTNPHRSYHTACSPQMFYMIDLHKQCALPILLHFRISLAHLAVSNTFRCFFQAGYLSATIYVPIFLCFVDRAS